MSNDPSLSATLTSRDARFSKLGRSIFFWFMVIALLPLAVASTLLWLSTKHTLIDQSKQTLTRDITLKEDTIEQFFKERVRDLQVQAELYSNIRFMSALQTHFQANDLSAETFVQSNEWAQLSRDGSGDLRNFIQTYGYRDAFLIDQQGYILFSVMAGEDLGTNLLSGPYSQSNLSTAWRHARHAVMPICSDLAHYQPTWNEPAMFLAQRIVDQEGTQLGVLAIQIPIDQINKIVSRKIGNYSHAHSLLVGSDQRVRAPLEADEELPGHGPHLETIDTPVTRGWLFEKEAAKLTLEDEETSREQLEDLKKQGARLHDTDPGFYTNHLEENVLGVFTEIEYLHDLGLDWALITEIEQDEAMRELDSLFLGTILVLGSMILLIAMCSFLITHRISSPIRRISSRAKQTAVGRLPEPDLHISDNEIGELADSFQKVVNSIQEVTEVCAAIAIGDFSKSVVIKGEHDALGLAVNQMAENLRNVVDQANAVAKGDYSGELEPRSNKDELSLALINMTSVLSDLQAQKERQDWLTSGEVQLRNAMQGDLEIHELGKRIIQFVCRYLNAMVGAFYVLDGEILRLVSSFAYRKRKGVSNEFTLGHGLVGQAALEGESILATHVPEDYVAIFSGLGSAPPSAILAVPFLYEDKVVGVLELGSFEVFNDDQIYLLEKFRDFVGIAVNTAQARSRMTHLLTQTQEQADALQKQQQDLKLANTELEEQTKALLESEARLQTQQEELRSTNEELEEQTRALRESQARLQAQQEELQQINEELEERSEALERQRDEVKLKNQELERARRELAEKARDLTLTSKYKSEFLANMSHELRTPLNSMLILSQLLEKNQKGNLNEKQVEYAKTIYQSGSDLLALINEILDLSKIEAGKMEVVAGNITLRPFLEDLALKFRPIAEEKGLEFAITIAEDAPESFTSDPHRCEQILRNLLSNALKFTDQGHVKLHAAVTTEDDNQRLTFAVEDSGLGIPEAKRRLIFEAFQQADGTTSRQFGGTGLGLSISRELAKLLQGDIQLHSEEGRGSTFTLRLPLEYRPMEQPDEFVSSKVDNASLTNDPPPPAPSEESVQKRAVREKAKALTATPLEPPSVRKTDEPPRADYPDDRENLQRGDAVLLIIEDDRQFQWTLQNLARERGFKCLLANNGEAGLHMADYYKPDAILLDIGLPRMDGMAVMSRLKDNPETRHIPVHFISGTDRNFEAMKMGAAGFLQKPATMADLDTAFNRISHILSHQVKNLLIVEDDAKLRSSLKALTGGKDVNVHGVGTARAALEALRTQHFDCMVLDVNLPDVSGYDLLSQIRHDSQIPHLPIIIYTGRDLSEAEKVQLDKYAESVIIKTANSAERLLDETILFLHRVEAELGGEQKRLLHLVHDKENIFREKKILVVDDDMRNVFALSSVLEEKGMTILVAVNGREGLEQLEKNPDIDLVLMDIMMPEMNGYEATKAIRQNPKYRNLPVIALTAKAMKGDRHKCIDAGANDYMSKPVDTVKLLSLMRVWLY